MRGSTRLVAFMYGATPIPYPAHQGRVVVCASVSPPPASWQSQEGTPFCIVDAGDGSVVGACGLFKFDVGDLVAEVGYWVVPWARVRGVVTEAITTLARWAVTELGLGRLGFLILSDNTASRAVAARCGADFVDGEGRDMVLYALVTD